MSNTYFPIFIHLTIGQHKCIRNQLLKPLLTQLRPILGTVLEIVSLLLRLIHYLFMWMWYPPIHEGDNFLREAAFPRIRRSRVWRGCGRQRRWTCSWRRRGWMQCLVLWQMRLGFVSFNLDASDGMGSVSSEKK